ncbi:substrate-binding periplasmic protein [Rheinheimera pleomorphica]|uniref:substrate-binding periplasmic protein n=1 Tax=Rheinheimera pleomorphica TaxID=2703963 RepID=UPI00141DD1E5|nr:transporter substrate-binding domain-containing protein [Rheinheimera pleomorphica]
MLAVRLLRALYLSCFLLLLSHNSWAIGAEPEQPSDLINLQLSAGEWPPFLSEHLPHQGVVAHLIRDIFAAAGYEVTFNFLPWARAYHDTANGKYAATAVWMLAEERTKDFLYSEPVLSEQFVFFYLKQRRFDWQQLTDLRGLLLGGGLGYSYGPAFDQALENKVFKMSRVGSTEQNFRRLAAGRIDAFAEEISVGYYTLNHLAPELAAEISHHPRPLLVNQSFLLFPQNAAGSAQLLQLFNQHLQQFKQSGRYQQYFDRLAEGGYQ